MATVNRDIQFRKNAVVVRFNIDGTVSNVTMVADLVDSNGVVLGTPASKTYTAAEAVAAGVTGTQAQAFQQASNTLTANYQTSVLGA